jgi:hypothetical protein
LHSTSRIKLPPQLGCLWSGSRMRGLSYNGRPVALFVCDCESSSKFAQLSVEDVVLGGSTLVLCSGVARIDQLRFESIA